jgi:uncharacterized protein
MIIEKYRQHDLFEAAKKGMLEVIESILSQGVDVESRDKQGNTAFFLAAANGEIATMDKLHREWDADIEARNIKGDTPLIITIKRSQYTACEHLLEIGADPNATNQHGESALYVGCLLRKPIQFTKLLLAKGADPDIARQNINHGEIQTPLMASVLAGSDEHSKVLLQHGADLHIGDGKADPIHGACVIGRTKALKLLLQHGASISKKDSLGNTPLDVALQNTVPACALILIEHGALKPLSKQELEAITIKIGQKKDWNEIPEAIAKELASRKEKAPEPTMGD